MIAICLSFSLLAAEVLDFDMTPAEKKQTGVGKLSTKQKVALQHWIDNHYVKRDVPLANNLPKQRPVISELIQNGRYLRLSDNTLWAIAPKDTSITQGWVTPVEIIVGPSGDSDYPYKLTNTLTGSVVRAQKVDQVPAQPVQTQPTGKPAS
jgi:hypothetical protein